MEHSNKLVDDKTKSDQTPHEKTKAQQHLDDVINRDRNASVQFAKLREDHKGHQHPLGVYIEIDERTIANLTKTFALKMQDSNAVESYMRRRVLWRPPSYTTITMLRGMNQLTWHSQKSPAERLVDMFMAPEWERLNIEEVSVY
jgi:hypothetical protein